MQHAGVPRENRLVNTQAFHEPIVKYCHYKEWNHKNLQSNKLQSKTKIIQKQHISKLLTSYFLLIFLCFSTPSSLEVISICYICVWKHVSHDRLLPHSPLPQAPHSGRSCWPPDVDHGGRDFTPHESGLDGCWVVDCLDLRWWRMLVMRLPSLLREEWKHQGKTLLRSSDHYLIQRRSLRSLTTE